MRQALGDRFATDETMLTADWARRAWAGWPRVCLPLGRAAGHVEPSRLAVVRAIAGGFALELGDGYDVLSLLIRLALRPSASRPAGRLHQLAE